MFLESMPAQQTEPEAVNAEAVSVSQTSVHSFELPGSQPGPAPSTPFRRLVWLSLTGPVIMIVTILVAAGFDPAYSHREPVSQLSAEGAPMAALVAFGLFAAGAGLMLLTAILWRLRTPLGRIVVVVGFASGLLIAISSFFPCSPGCPAPWTKEAAAQDVIHFVLVLAGFIGFGTAPAVAWLRLRLLPGQRSYRRVTGVLAFVIIATSFLTFTAEALPSSLLTNTTGIWQRISIGMSVVWFVITGFASLSHRQHP